MRTYNISWNLNRLTKKKNKQTELSYILNFLHTEFLIFLRSMEDGSGDKYFNIRVVYSDTSETK